MNNNNSHLRQRSQQLLNGLQCGRALLLALLVVACFHAQAQALPICLGNNGIQGRFSLVDSILPRSHYRGMQGSRLQQQFQLSRQFSQDITQSLGSSIPALPHGLSLFVSALNPAMVQPQKMSDQGAKKDAEQVIDDDEHAYSVAFRSVIQALIFMMIGSVFVTLIHIKLDTGRIRAVLEDRS